MVPAETPARGVRCRAERTARHRTPRPGVSAGTIRNELHLIEAMVRWGQGLRVAGKRLILGNPIAGLTIPSEKNAKRPIATEARFLSLLAVADAVEPTGRFRAVLSIARYTGRRIRAICELRRSDILLTLADMRRALAAAGMDLAHADHWPRGAVLWGGATDKLGFDFITPLSSDARGALDVYLRTRLIIGTSPLFASAEDATRPIGKEIAGYWLSKAERRAKLDHMERGGYHQFRRLYASERRHLPAADVAASGGWKSITVMRSAYQQADAQTVYSVVDLKSSGPSSDTAQSEAKQSQ